MTPFIHTELKNLVLGKKLGTGAYRKVYAHRQDKSLVVKVEEGGRMFSNVVEWETWQYVQYTALAKWFAPCVDISPCGSILLMKRVEPARMSEMPKQVPAIFTDLKIENWGVLDGKVVCCDYGNLLLNIKGNLKKAEWRNHD